MLPAGENVLFAPQNRISLWAHSTDTPATFAYPFTLLKYLHFSNSWDHWCQCHLQLCSLCLLEQKLHRWGQVGYNSQTGLDSSLTRSRHTAPLCLGGRFARDIFHHSSMPKSRRAKSWKHNLLSWKWISQAKLWKSVKLLRFLNTLHIVKNS